MAGEMYNHFSDKRLNFFYIIITIFLTSQVFVGW